MQRDLLPGEQRQEVAGRNGSGVGEKSGEMSQEADDVLGGDVPGAKGSEVERLVALAEALSAFVDEKRMMEVGDPPAPFRGRS